MLTAVVIAVVVAVVAASLPRVVFGLVLENGWKVSVVLRGRPLPLGLVVFFAELVACAFVGQRLGAWVGGSVVLLEGVYFTRTAVMSRRFQRACKGLLRAESRDASLALLEMDLERRRRLGRKSPQKHRSFARTAMLVGNALEAAGMTAAAVRVLHGVDPAGLDALSGAMRAQNLAAYLLRGGDRAGAREALSLVARPVPDATYEDALAALDTLLVALEGDPRDAEARARAALLLPRVPNVRASFQAALAHALAAQGSREEAIGLLREMSTSHGAAALERVARHEGPASPLAESLLAETGEPYR